MGIVIGIDVGGSTTKIVGIDGKEIKNPMFVRATDPVTSLFGAFGKYLYDNDIPLSAIEKVMLTGVGSAYINQPLYGLPTAKTDEFLANGTKIEHIGGIGIGGGTVLGLSRLLLKTQDFHQVVALALKGDITTINLQIKDICNIPLPGLPLDATASTFGKADANTSHEDVALGIIYMVLQCIGQSVILAALNSDIRDFVLIGNLTKLPQCKDIFPRLEDMYGGRFHIPDYAEYRTAIGAALTYINKRNYLPIV